MAASRITVLSAAAIAASLHIQPTISAFGATIRFSLSDVVILLLFPFLAWLVARNRHWLSEVPRSAWLGLLAATAVMTCGIGIAAMSSGGASSWALVKYAGWFVLLAYAMAGYILGRADPEAVKAFAWTFIGIHVALVICCMALAALGIVWPGLHSPRMTGLISNPNAYGLAAICAIVMLLWNFGGVRDRTGPLAWEAAIGLLCAGILFSRSVGSLGGAVLVLALAFYWMDRTGIARLFRIVLFAALAYTGPAAIFITLSHVAPQLVSSADLSGIMKPRQRHGIESKLANPDNYGRSVSSRMESNRKALELWSNAPVFGGGLGAFMASAAGRVGPEGQAMQIHNTALWLLAELGLVGFGLLAGLYFAFMYSLYRRENALRNSDPVNANFLAGAVAIMIAWGGVSMLHELMYQRIPWFILALCAGCCATVQSSQSDRKKMENVSSPRYR